MPNASDRALLSSINDDAFYVSKCASEQHDADESTRALWLFTYLHMSQAT